MSDGGAVTHWAVEARILCFTCHYCGERNGVPVDLNVDLPSGAIYACDECMNAQPPARSEAPE